MPTLSLINFNIVCATLGGFISIFGLVSYLFKEKFYLSEALISLLAGVIFSPHATNLIRPKEYALNSDQNLEEITMYFTRLVLGVQLVLAGVQLPKRYLQIEWKSLLLLLGPGMAAMWLCSSLVIWAMVPHLNFLHALVVGACVTPTDPVLSNSIVKGKFADKNVPRPLQRIIVAESGANDGLGYPFLFFAMYLLKYVGMGGEGYIGGAGKAMGLWFYETWCYTVILSVVYGITVGWISRELLHWAEEKHYVDRESFLVFAIALALFILGTCGMIGTDDLLACFVAGNVFTQDDWFRLETMDDSLQPTIDMLLNLAVFMWFGAVCPWSSFLNNDVIPIYRLIFLGVLILLIRRMPIIFALHKYIGQIEHMLQAAFVGFFGPIGVGAIFYLSVSREFLQGITVDGAVRSDAQMVSEAVNVVVWFLVICSIVVHGLSIPLVKAGYHIPRTISNALSVNSTVEVEPVSIENVQHTHSTATQANNQGRKRPGARETPQPGVLQLSKSVIRSPASTGQQLGTGYEGEPERPVNLVTHETSSVSSSGHNTPATNNC
ncbi:Sodium/hydrogen exchanger family-domain-containing protein [Aspergillus avenaceus]|uniref:Sodium/hydrogen exchanger family-domain-containing protein n=1 Tax=Aspergillus avenaceus TaxID=36643 RepID=A0A5N6TWH6_ASPAV|nr:Sodium/hydrogen exchanger family-domain-containing protein [Aspergillus avenaceus]